jgi:hypothetical protein
LELEGGIPAKVQRKRPWPIGSKWLVYVVIAFIVSTSAVTAGWAYVRHDRGLDFVAYTDKNDYSSGESIRVWVEFTNYGFDSVNLTFGTSAMAHFSVYTSEDAGVCSIPVIAMMVITEATIRPGESVKFGATWDQLVYDANHPLGEQVPYPGAYYILAGTASYEFHATALTATFTISGSSVS